MPTSAHDVTIIGAGLAGLGTALALNYHGISCAIYEQTPAAGRFAGALMLSPNSLRILDQYGIYRRILDRGCEFQFIDFQDGDGKSIDHQYLGSKTLFGYDALRIYRNVLLKELQQTVQERAIPIFYEKKFIRVVEEGEETVTVEFQDGSTVTSHRVVAADGIHSKIRSFLYPDIQPKYTGALVVAGAVKRTSLTIPPNTSLKSPITQVSKGSGAFILAEQLPDGSELLVGTQHKFPEQDRQRWDQIASDHSFQQKFLEEGIEHRSELMKSAIQNVIDDSRYTWPQRILPPLSKWTSDRGRIIIIGDAAHAIPPITGQGANQAFEDGYTLAMLLAKRPASVDIATALAFWQKIRQERMAKLLDLTRRINNNWLPIDQRKMLNKEDLWESGGSGESLRWLFAPELDQVVGDWIRAQEEESESTK